MSGPDVYKLAQQSAADYLAALRGAYDEISKLIGYGSLDVLYDPEDLARMQQHKKWLEELIGDTAFNAKVPGTSRRSP